MNIALLGIDHLRDVLEHFPELAGVSHFRVTMADQTVHQVTRAGLLELAQTCEAPRIAFSPVEPL
jgi:2-oxo-4-hydroxy-4-carboxy--5-ureidoimidazoline (OHCU) decarboxylase